MSFLRTLLGDQPLFTFEAAGGGELRVLRFFGREGLSGLFGFHLELAGGEVDLAAIVDKPGVLKIGGIEALAWWQSRLTGARGDARIRSI